MTLRTGGDAVPVEVALINDHELVLRGLERMLEEFQDQVRVVELDMGVDPSRQVDVALYDTFSATQVTGTDIDEVVAHPLVGSVVVFTWNMHRELVDLALAKGVRGYLSKSLSGAELAAALQRVAAGEQVVLPEAVPEPGAQVRAEVEDSRSDWPGREQGLTARQAEVVSLIAQGYTNQEICERTYLSLNTVKSYIREAYRTMRVSSRTQAVLWGIDHGMVPTPHRVLRGDVSSRPT